MSRYLLLTLESEPVDDRRGTTDVGHLGAARVPVEQCCHLCDAGRLVGAGAVGDAPVGLDGAWAVVHGQADAGQAEGRRV